MEYFEDLLDAMIMMDYFLQKGESLYEESVRSRKQGTKNPVWKEYCKIAENDNYIR